MAPLSDYVAGTITLTTGSAEFTGTGTGWLAAGFREGDLLIDVDGQTPYWGVIATIDANDAGTLTQPWQGTGGTYTYRMRYMADGQRVTAQARQLIELLGNGNLQAVAGLDGTPNTFMMFTGPGALVEIPRTDLISGANYDVQVDTLAERDAYDGQDAGFSVLVSDTGDGRSAIYSRLDPTGWSNPAYVTGPSTDVTVGDVTELAFGDAPTVTGVPGAGTLELDFGLPAAPTLAAGSTTTGEPGTDADVTVTPVTGGYELEFTIPAGEGFQTQGDYDSGETYALGDVVQNEGSSWVASQAVPTGEAPPSLPTTSNTYWNLLARAGNDGLGTVTSLVAGDGIAIDSTDPTQPVISVDAKDTATMVDIRVSTLTLAEFTGEAIFLGPDGSALHDPFNDLTYVDVAGATNLDTSEVGVLKPTYSDGATDSSPAATGTSNVNGTQFHRGVVIDNGESVKSIGLYANQAATYHLKIARRESPNVISVVVSEAFSHTGSGWEDFDLASPFSVPETGTYWPGVFVPNISGMDIVVDQDRVSGLGSGVNAVGDDIPCNEDNGNTLALRVTYAGTPNDLEVASQAVESLGDPATINLVALTTGDEVFNTDAVLSVSRDEGETWAPATMAHLYDQPGGVRVLASGPVDVSGQDPGNNVQWRLTTANEANVSLRAVSIWGDA